MSDRTVFSILCCAGRATVPGSASSARAMAGMLIETQTSWSTVSTVGGQARVTRATEPASRRARPRMSKRRGGAVAWLQEHEAASKQLLAWLVFAVLVLLTVVGA